MSGKIDDAIVEINKIDADIFKKNKNIHFEIQKQKLIEIIKRNSVEEAILFTQNTLFPITLHNVSFVFVI